MSEYNPTNVSSAFEMQLEEVEAEIDFVNGVGAKAFEGRDYEKDLKPRSTMRSRAQVANRRTRFDLPWAAKLRRFPRGTGAVPKGPVPPEP